MNPQAAEQFDSPRPVRSLVRRSIAFLFWTWWILGAVISALVAISQFKHYRRTANVASLGAGIAMSGMAMAALTVVLTVVLSIVRREKELDRLPVWYIPTLILWAGVILFGVGLALIRG